MEKNATTLQKLKAIELSWDECLRAFLCMTPCLIAGIMGNTATAVPLGQAGFFFLMLSLPLERPRRLYIGSLCFTLGLGFYLIGGNVVFNPWLSVFFTFFVGLNLVFLSSWKVAGPLALTLFTMYSAGLNASSAEKVHNNFMAFSFALIWASLIGMLPIFKGEKALPAPEQKRLDYLETGFKFGIGTATALLVSNLLTFSKLGWAPSAVGNIIRFDTDTSKKRAWIRFIATMGGATIAAIALATIANPNTLLILGVALGTLNGLLKKNPIGKIPLLYTATILILYSINDAGDPAVLVLQRIAYNMIGIGIGLAIALYPFPAMFKRFKMLKVVQAEDVQF